MALIERFDHVSGDKTARHKPVLCGWRSFDVAGARIVQLDTYGTSDRQDVGTVSQTIQLDLAAAGALVEILLNAFPELSSGTQAKP